MCSLLILNSVPVTSVTDPELIRPSIPVMTHSLDQKVVARKAKARKCTAEVAGNVQAYVKKLQVDKPCLLQLAGGFFWQISVLPAE